MKTQRRGCIPRIPVTPLLLLMVITSPAQADELVDEPDQQGAQSSQEEGSDERWDWEPVPDIIADDEALEGKLDGAATAGDPVPEVDQEAAPTDQGEMLNNDESFYEDEASLNEADEVGEEDESASDEEEGWLDEDDTSLEDGEELSGADLWDWEPVPDVTDGD